jgi:hypothetical protein
MEMLHKVLEASRSLYRHNPNHLTFRQAARNLVMAFNLKMPPAPEELRLFFRSIWPAGDLVIDNHFDALANHLEAAVRDDWLGQIICPRLSHVRSLPVGQQAGCAQSLGIHQRGQINSGLAWGARGYFLDTVWMVLSQSSGYSGSRNQ